jgi:hypothetical protein
MTQATNTAQIEQSIHDAFGFFPEDVVAPAKAAADMLHWLDEIFKTIAEEADKNDSASRFRIKHLAKAGAFMAFDHANYIGGNHEEMTRNLAKAGIKIGGAA